ncbi:preprotein translocase subunit SecE [Patescibacteria group bacterium]
MSNKVIDYFKEARHELKKVAWPTRKEVVQSTIMVIVISLIVAAFLGTLDFIFNIGLENIL